MPTANPFRSFGSTSDTDTDAALFTGFAYCPEDIDVSGFDYWTSLSGWSKVNTPANDAAKAQSIEDSWDIAMALFWNAAEMEGFVDQSSAGARVTSTGVTSLEPEDRDCSKVVTQSDSDFGNNGAEATLSLRLEIRKLYNGTEFVGYGARILGQAYISYIANPSVTLTSWANDIPPDPFEPTVDDVDYTTLSHPSLGNIHLVCSALILEDFAVNPSVDASNRIAEDLFATARIDSIDFYTYPT